MLEINAINSAPRPRPILRVVAVVLLLFGGGCNVDDDSSGSGPNIEGEWNGTWSNSVNQSGTLRIVFSDDPSFPISVRMSSTGCASSPPGFDSLLSQSRPFAGDGNISFTVGNCDCVFGIGCLFAGGIFTFTGTYGSRQMQGTYEATSMNCDCCSCMSNRGGTWEVSR